MIQPTSTHCKLLISAVTQGDTHLFHPDHFAGHSLVACPFADNSSPHVYLQLLASLLPPSSRQPGPVAVLLGQMLKLSCSHSLEVDRETSSSCFSRVFPSSTLQSTKSALYESWTTYGNKVLFVVFFTRRPLLLYPEAYLRDPFSLLPGIIPVS